MDNEGVNQIYKDLPAEGTAVQKSLEMVPSPQKGIVRKEVPCEQNYGMRCEESPIARMQHENKLLMARYSSRLQAASTAIQRQNLQLELERRLTENAAIARQRQEVWEQRRSEVAARCLKIAEIKFKINEKIKSGTITEMDFKKHRVYAAALQYEEENFWLKKSKQDILFHPQDEKLQRDIISQILFDRVHPIGCLLCQMQYAVLDKVNPIITKHQTLLVQKHNNTRCSNGNCIDTRHQILSGIDHGLCNLSMNGSDDHEAARKHDASEETIVQEEWQAFYRHFQNIAIDIRHDIKLLETLLISLIEPLNTEKGRVIVTEMLHQVYFAPIKSYLIVLLRLITHEDELEFEAAMLTKDDSTEMGSVEEDISRQVCGMLQHLISLHSPCQMLDILVTVLKLLASTSDENNYCKSLGADDLLPRLTSVVISCGLPSLLAEVMYMENFMPTDRALGEGGYSLTVLQSVMSSLLPHSN
ncbi:uncharacterized protein LOC110840581 isoform X2 [Zootermopsis nevadensis]|nr:uncharacterized protein LOC110840581 isoform X2 [Zootermopsis nevadensis]